VQPAEAAALGEIKVNDLCATGATVVASANIGCSLQIRQHMENQPQPLKVLHPMQLLAESAGLLG
jgi:glycolate oxidase iron-sulfur subunit